MDETAHDPTQGRTKTVGAKRSRKHKAPGSPDVAAEASRRWRRSFEKTDADKAKFHVTDVMVSNAAGKLGASMLIMSAPGVEEPRMREALLKNIVFKATTDEERASQWFRDGWINAEGIDVSPLGPA
jgi:hypothetical protein